MTRAGPRGRTSAPESRLARWLERLAILLAALALSVGLIILLSGFFAGRDQAGVSGAGAGPGQAFVDLGHATLRPGQPRPAYNSNPPTSGAHVTEAIPRPGAPLNVDQLLSALQVGDVVILYGGSRPPAGLEQFARTVAPPFSPELAATGDAVILARRPGTEGLLALAWAHMLRVGRVSDPALRDFVGFWLGRGAPAGSTG
jgi:Protein of unknown function (DUF3105)